jgi:hypothetical protein
MKRGWVTLAYFGNLLESYPKFGTRWVGKEKGEEMRMGPIPPPFPNGKGAERVMAVVIFHSKATFVFRWY